jgi:methionyl-tRNA synthetase
LEQFRFREALAEFMNVARLGNKYLADEEPWKIIKTDEERVKTILNVAAQIVANLAVLAQPFLPKTAIKLFEMLNFPQGNWNDAGSDALIQAGHQLGEVQLLFDKITDEQVDFQLNKLAEAKAKNLADNAKVAPAKDNISVDDCVKMDIRVGIIAAAEKVAKTKKLLKLTIDTGLDTRTVVSGIAEFFSPEEIVGRQVSILVNLEPREIKGIMSQGMILMAEDADGRLDFVKPDTAIKVGSTVR